MNIASTIATTLLAQQDDAWWDHMSGTGGGWMWLWGTLMMLTWVAVIAAAVWLVARSLGGGRRPSTGAREILDERYARGELTTEEYRERLDQLR
jgi:putative membrane protein